MEDTSYHITHYSIGTWTAINLVCPLGNLLPSSGESTGFSFKELLLLPCHLTPFKWTKLIPQAGQEGSTRCDPGPVNQFIPFPLATVAAHWNSHWNFAATIKNFFFPTRAANLERGTLVPAAAL